MRTGLAVVTGMILAALLAGCGPDYPQTAEGRYLAYCSRCHEVDGSSITASEQAGETISIRDPDFQRLASDEDIRRIILRGKGRMMPISGISDAEVDSVILHVRLLGDRYASTLDSGAATP